MAVIGGSTIASPANPMIRAAHALLDVRERRSTQRFLLEGVKHIHDAIGYGSTIHRLFVHRERVERTALGRSLLSMIDRLPDLQIVNVNERAISAISDVGTNQGIVAEMAIPAPPEDPAEMPFLLVLDHVCDPGNMGTIIRSAAACGVVDGVVVIGGTDPYGPKVVRSSAAALLFIPIISTMSADCERVLGKRHLIATAIDGATRYDQFEWPDRCGLIIGSEGSGVSSALRDRACASVRIPIAGRTESLNAGVAASILLFDIARRRTVAR